MNTGNLKWWWLAIPGVIFVLIFLAILLKLPKPEANSTTQSTTTSPTPAATPIIKMNSELESLNQQIINFRIDDPQSAMPNYDRKIELPKE